MIKFEKKIVKGLTTGIKIRKPRYYYQDIVEVFDENATKNIELVKFEGLDYESSRKIVKFREKMLWNETISPETIKILAPNDGYSEYLAKSDFLVYDIVGNPTISNNVVSGFSGSSYIKVPYTFLPGSKDWEIVFKVTTPSSFTQQRFFGSVGHYYKTIGGEFNADGKFGIGLTSGGSTWDIAWMWTTNVLQVNTNYWIKISFTGTQYKLELSTDGVDYILENSKDSTAKLYQDIDSVMCLGYMGTDTDKYFLGFVDLNECYIKINGTTFWGKDTLHIREDDGCLLENFEAWKGASAFCKGGNVYLSSSDNDRDGYFWGGILTSFDYLAGLSSVFRKNYTTIGKLQYIDNFIVRGFTGNNYIQIAKKSNYSTYEMLFRVRIYKQSTGYLLWGDNNGALYINSSKKTSIYDGKTTINGSTIIATETEYEFKLVWDGTNTKWYTRIAVPLGTEENPWVLEGTYAKDIFATASILRIGGPNNTSSYYWKGDIMLLGDYSYIIYDGEKRFFLCEV